MGHNPSAECTNQFIFLWLHSWSLPFAKCMLYLGCSFSQFRCTNGQCVSSSFRCNGIRGCTDGSDERNCSKFLIYFDCFNSSSYIWTLIATICTVSCQSGAFRCNNGTCISSSDRCDGNRDCTDGSDEIGCSKLLNYLVWWIRIHTSVIDFFFKTKVVAMPSFFLLLHNILL